jgi:hypothetical protein
MIHGGTGGTVSQFVLDGAGSGTRSRTTYIHCFIPPQGQMFYPVEIYRNPGASWSEKASRQLRVFLDFSKLLDEDRTSKPSSNFVYPKGTMNQHDNFGKFRDRFQTNFPQAAEISEIARLFYLIVKLGGQD